MARMQGADWQGEHGDYTLMTRYDIVCIHTIVGNPPAHAAHFSVRSDGYKYQSRDTKYQSAANYNGNPRIIAIENDDWGSPFPDWGGNAKKVPPFTKAQIAAIAEICVWAYRTHGIPLEKCPNSRPTSRGIAYHRQGIDGNFLAEGYDYSGRVYGGEVWTLYPGKVCPGDARIAQIPTIIERARILAGLQEEDDMPSFDDRFDLTAAQDAAIPGDLDDMSLAGALGYAAASYFVAKSALVAVQTMATSVSRMSTKVDALTAKVDELAASHQSSGG